MNAGDRGDPKSTSHASESAGWAAVLPRAGVDAADVLTAVFRMSPLAMVLTDATAPDQPVVFCNQAFVRLTGYLEKEVVGRNCRFLQGCDTDLKAIRLLRDAVQAGSEAQVDLWNYRKDGSAFWNSMFVGPVTDADGKPIYYLGTQTDSSARRATEEAANRQQRVDTLGSMAAGLAHEVNNLMTVVLGNVESLQKSVTSKKQIEQCGYIEWAARGAGKLTRQMLSFAGRQGLQAEVVDLNDVLRGLDHLLGQVAPSPAGVELVLHPAPLLAEVDVNHLELALLNLVRNAADASPSDSRITIAVTVKRQGGPDIAEIAVTDRGTGMSSEVAAKATEPFFTTKGHGKGTGLGLSMVAGFCQESGGSMSIQTEAGRGTTIRLAFPLLKP